MTTETPLFDTVGIATPTHRRARPRLRTAGFPEMPIDVGESFAANLTLREDGAMMRLRRHLWFYGSLPPSLKGLAGVVGVGPKTFAGMIPAIEPHFDVDEHGRWRHYDLEERRDAELTKRLARSQAGRDGAARRWFRDADPVQGVTGADLGRMAGAVPQAMATAVPTGMPTAVANPMASGMAPASGSAIAFANGSGGSIDRFFDDIDKTNDRSSREGAATGMPDADAIGKPTGILDAMPARSLDEVDDEAMIAVFVAIRSANIPSVLLNPSDMAPVRAMIADGCELERDIVPAVTNFVRGLRAPLRSFAAGPIRDKALASRDQARERRRAAPTARANGVFVEEGGPAWRAWLRAKGVRSHFTYARTDDRTTRGAHFETAWPAGWDETRLLAAESPVAVS